MSYTQSSQGGSATPNVNTLKVIIKRQHYGVSRDAGKQKDQTRLSAAANRIRLNNDFQVTVKSDPVEPKASTRRKTTESFAISGSNSVAASTALIYMQAWDELYNAPGTEAYIRNSNVYLSKQNEFYNANNIIVRNGIKPELTETQRAEYDKVMSDFSFEFYSVQLSYKQHGKKAVVSSEYRYEKRPDAQSIIKRLNALGGKINSELNISTVNRA